MDSMDSVTPRFTLHHLEVLIAVAETGTVTAAAARLHLSPSSVSAALTELEARLGITLMVRRRAKGVTLTANGTAALAQARRVLAHARNLQLGAAGEGPVLGRLRVGCFPTLAPTVLPDLVDRLIAAHPKVTVEFFEGDQVTLRQQMAEGEIELALVYDIDSPLEWHLTRFATGTLEVLLPADHPLAEVDRPIDLVELKDDPMVLLDRPPGVSRALEVCARSGFAPKVAYRTPSFETARSFVGRGLGWTITVQRVPTNLTYEGLPVVVKEIGAPFPEPVAIALARSADTHLSRAAQAFMDAALSHLS